MENSFVVLVLILSVCGAKAWTYPEQDQWVEDYPTCGSTRQSPIAINSMEVVTKTYPLIQYFNYETANTADITNNGHTAEIQLPNTEAKPQISGGPLANGTRYEFVNVHFHWGANDSVGSEHVVNGQRYSMEVHAVHYNTKYSGLDEALENPDGIAVLTTFYESNPTQSLAGLQSVSDALPSITEYETSTQIENFRLSQLFRGVSNSDRRIFYSYPGSLTTPPCSEAVTWIIFATPIAVTPAQLKPFRTLQDEYGQPLVDNFRNLQKKNGRKVYLNRPKSRIPLIGRN